MARYAEVVLIVTELEASCLIAELYAENSKLRALVKELRETLEYVVEASNQGLILGEGHEFSLRAERLCDPMRTGVL